MVDFRKHLKKKGIERITPKKDQILSLEALNEFKNSKRKEFTLSGRGGTGKTTVIREFFAKESKSGNYSYIPRNIVGMTVAHKARINLQNSIPESITYASGMGLSMQLDEFGQIYFIENKNGARIRDQMKSYKWLVFDEASMVDDKMRILLNKTVRDDCKIIYMGDFHQLGPIEAEGDDDSPVFNIEGFELREPIRQNEGDYILDINDRICAEIKASNPNMGVISNITNKYNTELKKGVYVSSFDGVIKSYINNPVPFFEKRITCYRNSRVNTINNIIRSMLFPDSENPYVKGDFIVMNKMYDPESYPIAYNGEEFIVEKVEDNIVDGINVWEVYIKKAHPLFVVKESDKYIYQAKINDLKRKCNKSKKWHEFMSFTSQFADISYGYAVTNYKVQGTTLHTVYTDLTDIMSVTKISNKRKLQAAYVGFSRPTHNLAIFVLFTLFISQIILFLIAVQF